MPDMEKEWALKTNYTPFTLIRQSATTISPRVPLIASKYHYTELNPYITAIDNKRALSKWCHSEAHWIHVCVFCATRVKRRRWKECESVFACSDHFEIYGLISSNAQTNSAPMWRHKAHFHTHTVHERRNIWAHVGKYDKTLQFLGIVNQRLFQHPELIYAFFPILALGSAGLMQWCLGQKPASLLNMGFVNFN